MSELATHHKSYAHALSLESLPEIERENILASRQEEIQKFKDAAQLDAMYKMAGMTGDDDDDMPARKQR